MKKINAGALLFGSTIVWAAVIVGTALVLRGTEYKEIVNRILFIGLIIHLQLFNTMLFWLPAARRKKGKTEVRNGLTIILSAMIWGGMMIASAIALKGTGFKDEVQRVIHYGTVVHLLFIWGPIGIISQRNIKKKKQHVDENDNDLKDA